MLASFQLLASIRAYESFAMRSRVLALERSSIIDARQKIKISKPHHRKLIDFAKSFNTAQG
jgi:hypothetical protein